MSAIAVLPIVLLAVSAQVTVAPLFPFAGEPANLVLIAVVGLAAFGGGRTAMVAVPVAALFEGLTTDRHIAGLILAYAPLLPLALWLEVYGPVELPSGLCFGIVLGLGAVWARMVAGGSAFLAGADFAPLDLVLGNVIPGLVIDLAVFAATYGAGRALRLRPASMTLGEGVA